eukprot:7860737-Ditylum_brightwellii.AAC.1
MKDQIESLPSTEVPDLTVLFGTACVGFFVFPCFNKGSTYLLASIVPKGYYPIHTILSYSGLDMNQLPIAH